MAREQAADSQQLSTEDALAKGFVDPPNSARPRVWWHWLNGNVTREGVEKDLDWLADIGIGGVQNFDANLTTPQIVEQRLVYMSPEWKAVFRLAVAKARTRGLEFAIAASPGWSETGGPWVQPQDGMKKLTWSETVVPGGRRVGRALPPPPKVTGPFQDLQFSDLFSDQSIATTSQPQASGDIAILAIPARAGSMRSPATVRTGSDKLGSAASLTDNSLETTVSILAGTKTSPTRLEYEYADAQRVSSARVFIKHARPPFAPPRYSAAIEAEVGGAWVHIADVPLDEASTTVTFNPVSAKRFRLLASPGETLTGGGLGSVPGAVVFNLFSEPETHRIEVGEFQLFPEHRVEQVEAKAGFGTVPDYHAIDSQISAVGAKPTEVIDITNHLQPDGSIAWTAPRGSNWRIIRLGWSLTGKTNHPATPEATGLEVDKYDAAAVQRYLDGYLDMYREAVGPENVGPQGIGAILTDSIEVGHSNWTPRLLEEFQARRGYDAKPWLPTLAGIVIGSTAESDRFLYDFRLTLAELLADAHYGTVARVAHQEGMTVYGEALEDGRPVLGDDLDMRRHADVPMAALWTFGRGQAPRPGLLGDMKGAASVASFYGKSYVAAESMTSAFSPWAFAPSDLKRVIDLEFAQGINRPVIHTSVHQPTDDKLPGLSLAIFGQYFNRHETWADMAKPWVDYLSRSSYMLQQGRHQADVAVFYGEDSPVTSLYRSGPPPWLPVGYGFDLINARMLDELVPGQNGELLSPGGARYRVIQLAGTSQRMTVGSLRNLKRLVDGGAKILGHPPVSSPSGMNSKAEFDELVATIWRQPGVIRDDNVSEGLAKLGLEPDFQPIGGEAGELKFLHRRLDGADIYFVNNRESRPVSTSVAFRVTGRLPEIWRAIDGSANPASYRVDKGRTIVPLDLAAEDAVFVVFRKPTTAASADHPVDHQRELSVIESSWDVSLQSASGLPVQFRMDKLKPLELHSDQRIRFFSGTATYSTRVKVPRAEQPSQRIWIDLGKIGDVAEVRINGKLAGTTCFAPYRLEVGSMLRPGENRVEIKVANLWVNRLIGDQQPGAAGTTWTAVPTYKPDAPLRPSGLLGPVRLLAGASPGLRQPFIRD